MLFKIAPREEGQDGQADGWHVNDSAISFRGPLSPRAPSRERVGTYTDWHGSREHGDVLRQLEGEGSCIPVSVS